MFKCENSHEEMLVTSSAGGAHSARHARQFGCFFHKSHVTRQQWLLVIYLWARQYPVSDVAEEAQVVRSTAIDIFQWLREVCTTKLLQTPIILGTVHEVQIDESLFRHKPKVKEVPSV